MDETDDTLATAWVEKRRYRRFELRCPVRISTCYGNSLHELEGTTINVSIGGLFLKAQSFAPENNTARFIISVPQAARPFVLAGTGKIVRVEPHGTWCVIAIQCDSPLADVEDESAASPTEL